MNGTSSIGAAVRPRRAPTVHGFTLIEVVLALALLALLLSVIQGAYTGAVRSKRRVSADTAEAHLASVVLQRMAQELSMAFLSPARREATGLVLVAGGDGLSTLSFTTQVPAISGFSPGGESEVGYFLEEDEEGRLDLMRRETTDLDGDLQEGGVPFAMIQGIQRFLVLCYDGTEWLEGWNSADRSAPPLLPLAVSVEVAWADPDDEEAPERVYRTSAPVYGIP